MQWYKIWIEEWMGTPLEDKAVLAADDTEAKRIATKLAKKHGAEADFIALYKLYKGHCGSSYLRIASKLLGPGGKGGRWIPDEIPANWMEVFE